MNSEVSQFKKNSDFDQPNSSIISKIIILIMFIIIMFYNSAMPDFETYKSMYYSDGGHIAILNRDPGFVFLINIFNKIISYEFFRIILIVFFMISAFHFFGKIRNISIHNNVIAVLVLAPLIILKFGVQIREGLAISIWLWVLLRHNQKPNILTYIICAVLSTSMHLAVAPFWALLAIPLYLNANWRTSLLLGSSIYSIFSYIVLDTARYQSDWFVGMSDVRVEPDQYMLLYWASFPVLFSFGLLRSDTWNLSPKNLPLPVYSLGLVVSSAMLGSLVGPAIQVIVLGDEILQKGLISDIMRLASLVTCFYGILLVMLGKKMVPAMIAIFLLIDTFRIILASLVI